MGVAWLLMDEETGRVLRAGCKRLPATGEANDYSTKSEGEAVLEAVRDLLPGLPKSVQLVESTDSLGWKVKYEKLVSGQITQRRRARQLDTGKLRAVHREAGRRILRVEWQPADHNLPRHDDRRRHAQCQANKAVDAGAGSAAEGGRDEGEATAVTAGEMLKKKEGRRGKGNNDAREMNQKLQRRVAGSVT